MENTKLSDWERILFGKAPVEFVAEVFFRTIIIYLLLLVIVKLLGKRMSGRLTITEWAIMLTLGSLISLPMQAPERGILNGICLLILMFIFHRIQAIWTFHNRKAEQMILGKMVMLVKDGILQVEELDRQRLSREQLFAMLRGQKVYQLGTIRRLYQEATGDFSLYRSKNPSPGLSVLPQDPQARQLQEASKDLSACVHCGNTSHAPVTVCKVCGNNNWEQAVQ
jgi:uncharacterized membrane protein YcaP (DUF421 family)